MKGASDEELLAAVAAGPGAFPEFYRRHVARVTGMGGTAVRQPWLVQAWLRAHPRMRLLYGACYSLYHPGASQTRPSSGTGWWLLAGVAGQHPAEVEQHRLLELLVGAGLRGAVRPPAPELGGVAEAAALHVVVG